MRMIAEPFPVSETIHESERKEPASFTAARALIARIEAP
jgi:hypothetical protein